MDTGRILSWNGWNKCSGSFPLFSVSFSIQQTIFSVWHHFVNFKESTYPNLPFLGRWENLAVRAHPEVTAHSLISSCSPVAAVLTSSPAQSSLPARFRPPGVNVPSDVANNTSNPLLIFRCFYFSLWRETVWLQPRACTCTAGSVRSCSSHFITTPVDWLKPGENFYSSPLASQWAKAAKLYLSSWPTDPHFPGSCSPTRGGQQAATLSAWCERLRSASVAGNAGCWLLAWYKIQGTIKPIESN